jgi:hypothetical protein
MRKTLLPRSSMSSSVWTSGVDVVPGCSISEVYSLFDLEIASLAPTEFAASDAAIVRLIGGELLCERDSATELCTQQDGDHPVFQALDLEGLLFFRPVNCFIFTC